MKKIIAPILILSVVFSTISSMEENISDIATPMDVTPTKIKIDSEPLEAPINKPGKRKRLADPAQSKETKKRIKQEVSQAAVEIKTPQEANWHSLPDETKLLVLSFIADDYPTKAIKDLKNLGSVSREMRALVNDRTVQQQLKERIAEFRKNGKKKAKKSLIRASAGGDKTAVMYFKEAGANLNAEDNLGRGPLIVAAETGQKLAKYLINKGASVDCADRFGLTPLVYACGNNNTYVLKKLMQNGAVSSKDTLTNEIFSAVILEKKERINALLQQAERYNNAITNQPDPDFVSTIKDNGKRTLLMFAAIKGSVDLAQLLLDKRAHVNVEDANGFTPLAYAAFFGHEEMVKLLLFNGAEVNPLSNQDINDDLPPLIAAAQSGHKEIVELLLDKGALVNHLSIFGSSALMVACAHGHIDVVRLLLSKGAQVNLEIEGWSSTPLTEACYEGYAEIADLLIQHGATLDNLNSSAVLIRAIKKGSIDIIKLLLKHGVDFNVENCSKAPLAFADHKGYRDIVDLLKHLDATETP